MFTNPTFWFLVSFVLFFVFFGRAIWGAISSGLDTRSKRIEADIQEAMEMREQAQSMLNDIKKKQLEAGAHADAILEHARLEAERLRADAAKELDEYMTHREQLVVQRIEMAEREALKDIRDTAIKLAIQASEKIMMNVVTSDVDSQTTDKAIQQLKTASAK